MHPAVKDHTRRDSFGVTGPVHAVVVTPSRWLEVAVLTTATVAVTVMRSVLVRVWVFRPASVLGLGS